MFTFRNTTLLFFASLLTLNLLNLFGVEITTWWYFIVLALYFSISVAASFFISSGFHMKVACRRVTEHKVVAITFDDGPHPAYTPLVLDILKDRAKATFFCIGKNIPGNESLIKRMDEEGHLVGSHSYSHAYGFDLFPAKIMRNEFEKTEALLLPILKKRPLLFRPPYGVINPLVKNALKHFPYHVIGFNNRSFDTTANNWEIPLKRVIKQLKPGDIVLFHDTTPFAPELIRQFLEALSDKGFVVIGLDELLNIKPYEEH